MPSSYQAPTRGDKAKRTTSQTVQSNSATDNATVQSLLNHKGNSIFSIQPDITLGEAVIVLRDKRIGALLVTDSTGSLVGILSERDIVRKLAETPGEVLAKKVDELMTKKIETCTPEEPVVSVLRRMSEGRFRHMPVVQNGKLAGMITIGDVVNYRLTQLEHEALQLKQLIVG
ncbi:MAG: CBS domain-containing protein [Pseudomonadota bacterium]